jgi:hypothetical protein
MKEAFQVFVRELNDMNRLRGVVINLNGIRNPGILIYPVISATATWVLVALVPGI